MQQVSELGLDLPNKITMSVEYPNTPIEKVKHGLQKIKKKREQGYFSDVILIGEDDCGVEQNFDFKSLIKNITVNTAKNENERYDAIEVENSFFSIMRNDNV